MLLKEQTRTAGLVSFFPCRGTPVEATTNPNEQLSATEAGVWVHPHQEVKGLETGSEFQLCLDQCLNKASKQASSLAAFRIS